MPYGLYEMMLYCSVFTKFVIKDTFSDAFDQCYNLNHSILVKGKVLFEKIECNLRFNLSKMEIQNKRLQGTVL